jgi:hypothetical protein
MAEEVQLMRETCTHTHGAGITRHCREKKNTSHSIIVFVFHAFDFLSSSFQLLLLPQPPPTLAQGLITFSPQPV